MNNEQITPGMEQPQRQPTSEDFEDFADIQPAMNDTESVKHFDYSNQAQEIVDALDQELDHLFEGDGRKRLAVRCASKLDSSLAAVSGVYDRVHKEKLLVDLVGMNCASYNIWATLNDFTDEVKTTNALYAGASIGKKHITRIRWILLDFDPTRPDDMEATDEEREKARV